MKFTSNPLSSSVRTLVAALALIALSVHIAHAHPYASCLAGTNAPGNGVGIASFIMNESADDVAIIYDPGQPSTWTNDLGALPKGLQQFLFPGTNTSFEVICKKIGSGIPSVISSDSFSNSIWGTPRGVAVNKNAKIGLNFGNIVEGSGAAGGGKGLGLYLLNADQTLRTGPIGSTFFAGGGNGPYRVRANDDGTFLVNDFSTANACLLQFSPDLSSSNLVLSIIGQNQAVAAGIHGDLFGCGIMKGSLAAGNLVLYTFDSGMPAPGDTNCIKGPLTGPGSFNCVFQYNIGAGPLPWNKRPDFAYTYGLDGIAELRTEGDIGKDGKIICGFGRANASNPNIQILRPFITTNTFGYGTDTVAIEFAAQDPTNWLYTSGIQPPFNSPPPVDPWTGGNGSGVNGGTYAGVRVSPDGQFFASVDINNGVTIATLTNGIPNEGSIFGISQGAFGSTSGLNLANARGMDWDAANNLWICSSGQGLLRCYSLGLTTTCVTSNDWTGTNGSFQLVVPPTSATVIASTPTASQNYTNNITNPGGAIPGVFRITLNVSDTTAIGPVTASFVRSGTAAYGVNYQMRTNLANVGGYFTNADGVALNTNSVIFPAGVWPHAGNWSVDVPITPTATPVSGPTLTVGLRLNSGSNYSAGAPISANIAILNTGPQTFVLSAASPSTLGGMNRGIVGDQARFIITRNGDTNGPGNDATSVVPKSLTLTNFNYFGTAQYPLDYTAQAQKFTGSLPVDGAPGITINPGEVAITAMIGNPVRHPNPNIKATNVTVVINLTNHYTCPAGFSNNCSSGTCCTNVASLATNSLFSSEGYNYIVSTAQLTLNEFDNANGGELVLWSNPLTNSLDSTNWTLVFGSIAQGGSPTLPLVISNYDNSASTLSFPGAQYIAAFGKKVNDPSGDSGVTVPQSATMIANGWSNALKVTVNKIGSPASLEAGINLYPQAAGPWTGSNFMTFVGNYALRFDMYLSLYDFALNNPTIGTSAREYAAFGINHYGTNVNWRLDINPRADGTGARPIDADGEWCSIGAASGAVTPADYDMFISPAWSMPIYDNTGVNTNRQYFPFATNAFIINALTNAYQASPGVYTGATNIFANNGVPNDQVSQNNNSFGGAPENGIIKNPPFVGINNLGGAPDNAWVSVSLELTIQTNLTLKVAGQNIFNSTITTPSAGTANPVAPISGTPMLGYLDPNSDISDFTAFVYYSNVRVVELSPYIYKQVSVVENPSSSIRFYTDGSGNPYSIMVTQGYSLTLTGAACYATAPFSNVWYRASGLTTNNLPGAGIGAPSLALKTNLAPVSATNMLDSLTLSLTTSDRATNYVCVFTDPAGSVTSKVCAVEVVFGPTNKSGTIGGNQTLLVNPLGPFQVTNITYAWYTNTVNDFSTAGKVVASTHFGGVSASVLGITNIANGDGSLFFWCAVTNANGAGSPNANANGANVGAGGVVAGPATLAIGANNAVVSPAATNTLWGAPVTFTVSASGSTPFTYQWKKGGNNVANATDSSFTLASVTTADGGVANSYTAGVTNSAGGTLSSAGVLTVTVPPPTITAVSLSGGNVTLTFSSTNSFDTTNAFILQSCGVVTGPYTNAPGTFTGTNPFQVISPAVGDQMFYRLLHAQ